MADVTDTVLTLTLAFDDTSAPAMTAFNSRLAEQKTMLDATNSKMAEASAVQNNYATSLARTAAASDKETAAAVKEAETRIAQSQRLLVQEARQYEQETAGAARVVAAREAADARSAKSAELAATRAAASWDKSVLKLAKAGTVVGGIGVAFEAMGAKSVVSLDTAEKHVEAFTSAIGNGANQVPIAKMRSEIQDLADQTGISAAKITEGFYNIASSGLSASKTYAVLTESTKFAKASQTDAAVASGLLTAVTNAYHLSLAQIPKAQDDISQAIKQGNLEARDYAPALAQIIPVAAHLGVTLKDLGAWFTVSTNAGINATESGVYFGNMLNQILAPTYKQIKAVQDLGGTYDDLTVKNGNVQATLGRLNDLVSKHVANLKDLESGTGKVTQRAEIFAEQLSHADGKVRALFGGNMEAAKAFFILNANGGAQTSAALKGMQNDAGATDAAFKVAMTSMANQFDLARQAGDHLARELSGPLVDGLLAIAKDSKPAASGIAGLAHDHKTLTDIFDIGLVALLGTSVAIRGIKYVVEPLTDVLGKLAPAAKYVGGELNTMRLATLASTEGAVGMRIAIETLGPRFAAVAGAVVVYDIATGKLTDTQKSAGGAVALIDKAYAEHKLTLGQAEDALHQIAHAYPGTLDAQHELYSGTLQASRASYDHAQRLKEEAAAAQHLGDKLNFVAGITKGSEYKNLLGSGTVPLLPNGGSGGGGGNSGSSGPSATAPQYYLTTEISTAQKKMDDAASQVAYDTNVLHVTVQKHIDELGRTTQKYQGLETQQSDLIGSTAKMDQYTKDATEAGNRLTAIQHTIADEEAKGLPVSQAQRAELARATAENKKYTSSLDALTGKTIHVASALELLNKAALKGDALPAMYDAAAEAQKKLADKSNRLADVFAEVERRAGDYSAYLSQFNKGLQDALTNAEGRLAFDQSAKGDKSHIGADKTAITAAQKNLDAWSASVSDATGAAKGFSFVLQQQQSKLQDALSAAEGKLVSDQNTPGTSKRTILADEQAVRTANTRLNTFNKELSDLTPSFSKLESSAEKAAKALQKIEDRLSKPGAEGAETAQRVGQLNVANQNQPGVPQPGNYSSEGAWEAAQAAYFKKHAEDFYHNNPTALGSTNAQELKVEGVTPAQLLGDPAVKKYLETLTENKLKALGFTPGQLATIPGTDEWWKKANAAPAVKSGLTNIGTAGRFAQGGTFGGQAASTKAADQDYQNQVNLGVLTKANADRTNAINLDVARKTGDLGTQFSILSAEYIAGKIPLSDFIGTAKAAAAETDQETQRTIALDVALGDVTDAANLAKTAYLSGKESLDQYLPIQQASNAQAAQTLQRQIVLDKALGDTAATLTDTTTAYHQGNASLAELTGAYNDNQVAVAKTTAQDIAFYVATGQFTTAMSSISASLTGPLGDATSKLAYDFYTHSGNIEADTQSVKDHQAALDALTQATWDASYTAANPAQQSQMLNTLAQPMISAQSAQASSEQAVANAQLGVIAANSALEVAGINAMTTQIQDMSGIVKAESAVRTAQFSGQLAALNDLIPIQNDLYAITKATTPQMLQTAQEQLKIDRLTAVMDQDKAAWDIKLAQMQLQLAQDKMMVDAANAQAQMMIAMDNLAIANDALNVAVAQAKLQSDSLVIQNAIHTDLGGVQDYLNLIDGDLQNLSAAQDAQMQDQSQLGYDTGYANDVAAGGAGLLAGDQLGIDQGTAAAAASNQAYQLQLAQYKVEQNQQQLQQQLVDNQQQDNASLLSEIKTLQGIIAFQNSPASRRPLRSVGNVSTAQLINGWAATAASTQAA